MGLVLEKENMTDIQVGTNLQGDFDQLNKATIMMVDDEPTTMEVVKAFLQESGFNNFVLIEDSNEAMKALESLRPDLLLLDLLMPEVSGFDILKAVRSHKKFEHLPIIILTSSSDNEDKLLALDLGATDFLAKPVDPSELRLRVRNTLAAKAYVDQLAYCDPLTKLPNRYQFMDRLEWSMRWAKRDDKSMALLSIELDQYDKIKNRVGFLAGDAALCQIAGRIQAVIRSVDHLGHFEFGEEIDVSLFHVDSGLFSLLIDRIRNDSNAAVVAERLLASIREPLLLEGTETYATASIGIATYPTEMVDSATLMGLASGARDYAKNHGGNSFQFSSGEINTQYRKRLRIEAKLRKAMEKDQFILHYQPKVDVKTGTIMGVEALLRWDIGDNNFISPTEFVSVAEETGLILPIGEWVLNNACMQAAAWQRDGKRPIDISVNLSSLHFEDEQLPAVVDRIIKVCGLDPRHLILEMTESMLLEDIEGKINLMNQLKEIGLKLAIDDFGTGYSSLNYLGKLPIDELKIDRSFLKNLGTDAKGRALFSSLVFLSHNLGLLTVAEGVETEEQLQFLKQERCDQYQGFYFSPGLPNDELFKLLS